MINFLSYLLLPLLAALDVLSSKAFCIEDLPLRAPKTTQSEHQTVDYDHSWSVDLPMGSVSSCLDNIEKVKTAYRERGDEEKKIPSYSKEDDGKGKEKDKGKGKERDVMQAPDQVRGDRGSDDLESSLGQAPEPNSPDPKGKEKASKETSHKDKNRQKQRVKTINALDLPASTALLDDIYGFEGRHRIPFVAGVMGDGKAAGHPADSRTPSTPTAVEKTKAQEIGEKLFNIASLTATSYGMTARLNRLGDHYHSYNADEIASQVKTLKSDTAYLDQNRDQATRDTIDVLKDLEKIPLLKNPLTSLAITGTRIGLEALQGESSKADLLMDSSQLGIGLTKGMVGQGMRIMKTASENPPQLTSSSASNQNRIGHGQVPTSSNSNRPVVMEQKATGTHGGGSSQRVGHAERTISEGRTGPGFTSPDLNVGKGGKTYKVSEIPAQKTPGTKSNGSGKVDGLGLEVKKPSNTYSVTQHSVSRKIEREVKSSDILDALKKPILTKSIKYDQLGRPSQRFIGEKATVAINPETGKILSVNPTETKLAERILKKGSQ